MRDDLNTLFQKQCDFFRSGATRSLPFRREQLKKLYTLLQKNETVLSNALRADLNKGEMESYGTEIGPCAIRNPLPHPAFERVDAATARAGDDLQFFFPRNVDA